MRKLILITAIALTPFVVLANTQTHNVYVYKSGIDTSMYSKIETPDFVGSAQQGAQEGFAIGQAIKAKREAKKAEQRQAQYATDLIQGTGGLKNISADTILPLIQKYPEKSSELLNMLKDTN